MQTLTKANGHAGRIRIEITAAGPGVIQVTVMRACDNPIAVQLADDILNEIVRSHPAAVVKEVVPGQGRRGGPVGTPQEQRLNIVRGWLAVQGAIKEAHYAHTQGISTSTLRRWARELREQGKL